TSRRRHTIFSRDWSSDVCSSDLIAAHSRDWCLNRWEEEASPGSSRGNRLPLRSARALPAAILSQSPTRSLSGSDSGRGEGDYRSSGTSGEARWGQFLSGSRVQRVVARDPISGRRRSAILLGERDRAGCRRGRLGAAASLLIPPAPCPSHRQAAVE